MWWILQVACGSGGDISLTGPLVDEPVDECDPGCATVVAPNTRALNLFIDGEFAGGVLLDGGEGILCPSPGALPIGAELELRSEDESVVVPLEVDLRPFGYSAGREREAGPPQGIAALPAAWARPEVPLLEPVPESFASASITSPFLAGDILYFGGTDLPDSTYTIGMAPLASPTEVEGPILAAEDWDAVGQNSPAVVEVDGGFLMVYAGKDGEGADPRMGKAWSTDGISWEPDPANPLSFERASHPTMRRSPDGFLELWYGGPEGISYALSADEGESFVDYCSNPVGPMRKSAEVVWLDDRYVMTWALDTGTADDGSIIYEIHWQESHDGLRFTEDVLALGPGTEDWDATSVANGQVLVEDGSITGMLFVGNGPGEPGNGFGIVTPE